MKLAPITCQREILHAHMFCGIGVGAVRAGKRFTGIERDPRWFDAAVERIMAAVEALPEQELADL